MSTLSPVLDKVQQGRLCTGCGACAAITPDVRMEASADGFNRPVVDALLSPAQNKRIADICPGLAVSRPRATDADPLWGHIISLRSGHAVDPDLRFRASSGGALSAILSDLLNRKQVAFIVQTGADPAEPISNATHVSASQHEVLAVAGSRYAPSSPLAGIEQHLATGKPFAFVGKPCDVAALRAMARHDPRIDANVVCMISFFCAGTPSRRGAEQILQRMGVRQDYLSTFRYRGNGWPGAATAGLGDGSRREMSYRDSWGGILSKHVQFRCKICPDGTGNQADIVCADAWHGDEQGYPSFDEADGKSLILTRTPVGEAIVQAAMQSGALKASDQALAELEQMQPGQVSRMRVLIARLAALWITAQPRPTIRGFDLLRTARGASALTLLRNFLGTGRRVIQGRR